MNAFSPQTRRMRSQMLKLLSVQLACPTLFMYLPLATMFLLYFAGITSPIELTFMIGILMSTFPLSVPITIILSMKEYRQFFLQKLNLAHFAASTTEKKVRSKSVRKESKM
ncbi:hypothetical protein NECAME_18241 [Necator americanus]|uniref:Uncharacterized protein n=1 Tax=Necator americanus TaxID=51031 RepID=W2TAX3_NECAM|nr:hypothetical protein NECAME_18241 [Necator americanus]ETN78167.1 hypothetical protein NECAME_18241 [Necator americanus]